MMNESLGTPLHFWDVFQFTQVQPLRSPHKQCWTRFSRIFSEFQLCIEWGKENCKKISKRFITNWERYYKVRWIYHFGGARSKGFATLRNVSKLQFCDKIGQAKFVGFRFYSAIWRSESRISLRYLEITSISLIYPLTFSRKKELSFWLSWGLNRLTCVTRQIRGDSKLRD